MHERGERGRSLSARVADRRRFGEVNDRVDLSAPERLIGWSGTAVSAEPVGTRRGCVHPRLDLAAHSDRAGDGYRDVARVR